jgi:serine/threonine protein kinase
MAGRRFGPYELEELLGRGGMGEVWRAVDTRKARAVALKLLPSELAGDEGVEERFRREAQVASRLSDPHVIPIHDYGELHGRLYLDMRLVQGVDLAKVLKNEGALRPARAVSIISQVADALDAAHDDGLVHRDVKPSNILLVGSRRGSDDFVYLIDFGIAAGSMLGTRLTATGHAVGTAAYMAPERFTEDREADPRVDVYALGCVLYEVLTGTTPFEGTSFPNLMYQHLHTPPPRPSSTGELPTGLDEVVTTALSKDPGQRYRRVSDLADAARAALTSPRPTRVAPAPPAPHRSATPQRDIPTWAPAPHREVPVPADRPRWDVTPPPAPPSAVGPPVQPAAPSRGPWLTIGGVTGIVLHALWGAITITGTITTFAHTATSPLAFVGGMFGLLAVGSGVFGVVFAVGATRAGAKRPRRRLGLSLIALAAAVVFLVLTATFDIAATS